MIIGAAVGSIIAAIITAHIRNSPASGVGVNIIPGIIIAFMPGMIDMSPIIMPR